MTFTGSTSSIRIPHGIAPINGPKNGMRFVTPQTTASSMGYGIPITRQPIAIATKIISASTRLDIT